MADNLDIYDKDAVSKVLRATENPDGTLTVHHNIDNFPAELISAFSQLKTAAPKYRFDSQFTYQIDDDLWDESTSGDGTITYDDDNGQALLNAGATAGTNTAVLQSHYHAPYVPGYGMSAFITGRRDGTVPTNGEVGRGLYDGENGIYEKETASGITLNIETTTDASNQSIAQASWNIDPMDGTGPSGLTLDTTKNNILVIQFQALYVGLVLVGYDIDGKLWPVHAFMNANSLTDPYIRKASLPVRYWASTATDASDAEIRAVCCSVQGQGGYDLFDIPGRSFGAAGSRADIGTSFVPILAIRPKEQLNSIDQNALVIPLEVDVSAADDAVWVEIRRNATITAGSFDTDVDDLSVVEVGLVGDTTPLAVTADTGQLIDVFYLAADNKTQVGKADGVFGKSLLCYSHLLGAADNLVVMAAGGTTSDVYASVKWKEIR